MKIHDKLDKLIESNSEQQIILAKMQVDLAHHIKRSDQHEEHLKMQDKKIQKIWYILIAGAAAGISEYGAIFLKWLGL
jgi:hypothetical protein